MTNTCSSQTKEAKEGGKFAEEEYEKYRQAAKEAKENYLTGLKKHDEEREDLDSERELIKVIMRYLGVLHDVKATEKSIAAGGRDSIKDEVCFLASLCTPWSRVPASLPAWPIAVCSPLVLRQQLQRFSTVHLNMPPVLVTECSHESQGQLLRGSGTDLSRQETGVSDYYGEYKANTRAELKAKVRPKQDPGLAIDSLIIPRPPGCAAEDSSESFIQSCFVKIPRPNLGPVHP